MVASCNQAGRRRVDRLIRFPRAEIQYETQIETQRRYMPMKSTDKAVELSAQTTRNVFKRNSVLFAAVLLAALAGLVAFPDATVADAPQRHDQVPGFYRLKVGDLAVPALYHRPGVSDVKW